MAYDKNKILEDCVSAIRNERLTFFTDLALFVEPAMSTLYEWELEKSEVIKAELSKNRLAAKRKMRAKWEDSDNATLQIAAYKLIADKDELENLTVNKVDNRNTFPEGHKIVIEEITNVNKADGFDSVQTEQISV